jgi:hypothetical protein
MLRRESKKAGGRIIAPNGLPICCIRADGTLLENEHGDHPDYKFQVHAECVEPISLEHDVETHALIYQYGCLEHVTLAARLVKSGESHIIQNIACPIVERALWEMLHGK